ncbi:MAG: long-chain fatty acid--CoA ligase [Chitinophagaceae bacterium]|nr:long-chain fatty acid--CoA ligase [Chitinophagaceae bacterium]
MKHPTRLFDFITGRLEQFGDIPMLSAKKNGQWHTHTTAEVLTICRELAAGLLKLGLSANDFTAEKADKVALLSANRPEWIFLDYACQMAGIILCPIYPTTNPQELEFIFNDAEIKYAFAGDEDLYLKVKSVAKNVPSLQGIYTFNEVQGADHWTAIKGLADAESLEQVSALEASIPETNLATIIYTSGTTGQPKGVMLTHRNIVTNVVNSVKSFPFPPAPGKKCLSFLPLNHIFERMVTCIYLQSGIHIYYAESLETIGENLKEVKPAGFTTVPRLLEKVYDKIIAKGHELSGIKKKLFFWAVNLGLKYDNLKPGGAFYQAQLKLANKLIFKKWREGLGGNIEFIITGGAACQERLLRIFNAGKIPVFEGYGPTENSPVITVNRMMPGQTKFGTVGTVIEGQEVKLAEDGEILVKGPSVMQGYYKRPELTAETIKDGWLCTGDIGVWETYNGIKFLKITDRKKELFKTSGGKYVAPQPIENLMKESPLIEQMMVVGAERKFVGALIVPSEAGLREWMYLHNMKFTTMEAAIKEPVVLEHYKEIISTYNDKFNPVEQVKKFELLPKEWTIDGGELTPTLKIKRKIIMEKYKDAVESIYA